MTTNKMPTPSAQLPAVDSYPFGKVMVAWLIATAVASVLNLLIAWIATGFLGATNTLPLNVPVVIIGLTAVLLFIAAVVFWFLAKRGNGSLSTWNTVALVALILSFLPNVAGLLGFIPTMPGVEPLNAMGTLSLMGMHVVGYLSAILVFPRFGKA